MCNEIDEQFMKKKKLFVLQANSQSKFKFYNGSTRLCRRTALGPLLEHSVDRIVSIPNTSDASVLAFTANNKVGK